VKATYIKTIEGWTGDARLYELDGEIETYSGVKTNHVIVSATVVLFSGPETYIFAEVLDWSELPGSFRGGYSHLQEAKSKLSALLGLIALARANPISPKKTHPKVQS
jgi:hypothetical protein